MQKFVDIGGNVNLAVKDIGDGPPLLLVHGFPLNHTMWRAQIDEFAQTHRVIAPDLRGFGSSPVTPGTVTMQQFADDCAALLAALGIDQPVTFCGLSMGGYIAWQFVARHAARLSRLVLCDTRAVADTPEAAENRRKMAEHVLAAGTDIVATAMLPKLLAGGTRQERPEVVDAVRQMIASSSPEGIAAAQRGMAERADMQSLLPLIHARSLVIVGDEDAVSPPEEMRAIAEGMVDAKFVVIPNAGHLAPLENPTAFNAALRAFLA